MVYVKAALLALFVALALGGAGGAWSVRIERLPPEEEATVLAQSISVSMNNGAFCSVVLIPAGLVVVHVLRRRKRFHSAESR
jgi:hypothetical protein